VRPRRRAHRVLSMSSKDHLLQIGFLINRRREVLPAHPREGYLLRFLGHMGGDEEGGIATSQGDAEPSKGSSALRKKPLRWTSLTCEGETGAKWWKGR